MKHTNWLLIIFFCLSLFIARGQDSTGRFQASGVLAGYGVNLYPITYNPVFLMADFSRQLGRHKRSTFLAVYSEPQINLVWTDTPINIELGVNFGIRYYQQLSKGFYIYEMAGSGPHYINASLSRQSRGFLFSDNVAIAAFIKLKKNLFLNLQFEFRHISNAGLQPPNGGDNTLNFLAGVSWVK